MARKKSSRKSSQARAVSVRPSNGGYLQSGNPGNVGGTGRPPSAIREHLRGTFFERVGIIESIADGKPMQRLSVSAASLVPHLQCANCGESGQFGAKGDVPLHLIEIELQASASPKDRIAAMDLMAKYGLGALKEISIENVRERVAGTLEVIRQHVAPDLYQQMLPALRAHWS